MQVRVKDGSSLAGSALEAMAQEAMAQADKFPKQTSRHAQADMWPKQTSAGPLMDSPHEGRPMSPTASSSAGLGPPTGALYSIRVV